MICGNRFGRDDVAFCFASIAECSNLFLDRFDQAIGDEVVGVHRLNNFLSDSFPLWATARTKEHNT